MFILPGARGWWEQQAEDGCNVPRACPQQLPGPHSTSHNCKGQNMIDEANEELPR